jgi:hypothetical protein
MSMDLNIEKVAAKLTGKERAKLIIAEWNLQILTNKQSLTEADKNVLLNLPNDQMDVECWHNVEMWRWVNFIWRKDIERVWQVLLLAFQNFAILRDLGPDFEGNPFAMFGLTEMKGILELNLTEFLEYEEALKEIEEIIGISPFDDKTSEQYRQWFNVAKEYVKYWNIAVDELKFEPTLKITVPVARIACVKDLVDGAQWISKLTAKMLQERHALKQRNRP